MALTHTPPANTARDLPYALPCSLSSSCPSHCRWHHHTTTIIHHMAHGCDDGFLITRSECPGSGSLRPVCASCVCPPCMVLYFVGGEACLLISKEVHPLPQPYAICLFVMSAVPYIVLLLS